MWYAETIDKQFESEKLKALSESVAAHYGKEGDRLPSIESVFWEDDSFSIGLSDIGLTAFVNHCEELNEELIEDFNDEKECLRQQRADYQASVL